MLVKDEVAVGAFGVSSDVVAEVEVEHVLDSAECGYRLRYQIAELLIYFGWPLIVGFFLMSAAGVNTVISATVTVSVFLWPYLKGLVAGILAKKERIDPRQKVHSMFWFDGLFFISSPFLKDVRQYSALARSLDVIYNIFERFGVSPMRFPSDNWTKVGPFGFLSQVVKRWASFWGRMPIAQDVRTRLGIIADEYRKEIVRLATLEPGRVINILVVAGGSLQDVVMGISQAIGAGAKFRYRVFSIEPDGEFARARASDLVRMAKLELEAFCFLTSKISVRNPQRALRKIVVESGLPARFDVVVCVGLGDYYYSLERINSLLSHIDIGNKIIVANIAGNRIERWFLHHIIQWPKMRYRSLEEWTAILRHVWPSRKIKIIQTPHKIFNIAIVG